MTRNFALTAFALTFAAFAVPASAGTLNYQNGQTQWEATACTPPTAPAYIAVDGRKTDRSGNALSANVEAYNQYTVAVQQFLSCVSAEANQDLASISQQIGGQVQQVNNAWMQDLQKRNPAVAQSR